MTDPDDIPDECQWEPCDRNPTHRMTYRDPTETVYYCRKHADAAIGQTNSEYSRSRL